MERHGFAERYRQVRQATAQLCHGLAPDDFVPQSMPDASPVKWHLAHTTWFFETFVLARALPGYRPVDPAFAELFNSYYVSVGPAHARPQRGLLTRPTIEQVWSYREAVDLRMAAFFRDVASEPFDAASLALAVGLHHEEQHQELILTDLKHLFAQNPLRPAYAPERDARANGRTGVVVAPGPSRWLEREEGIASIGAAAAGANERRAFAFDNERPRHRVFLEPYRIEDRLVTCGRYLDFVRDGGYARPELWLSEGWVTARANDWRAPLYWEERDGAWRQFTLGGTRDVDPSEPVCHVSYFEADAFARWAGARLPTEAEWEVAAAASGRESTLLETGAFHPTPLSGVDSNGSALHQAFGDTWEWTASAYLPYPGFRPFEDPSLAEYNGKFMSSQMVLRGASCVTPRRHVRPSYRNFFLAASRWQFTGFRCAESAR